MQKKPLILIYKVLVFASSTLFINSIALADCNNKELVNGWGGNWTPFIMGTANKPSGLDMDILDAVIRKAGCRWINTDDPIPWKRHLKLIELGRLDLATAASWTEERSNYAYFTEPYRTEHVAIYVLKENFKRFSELSLEQLVLKGFRLGVARGDVHGEIMGQFVYELGSNVHVVDSNSQNIEKLLLNRIDGFIGYPPSDTIEIKKKKVSISVLPKTVQPTGKVHIMLSKENNSLEVFEALNQAVIDLHKDGTIKKIKMKYESLFDSEFY